VIFTIEQKTSHACGYCSKRKQEGPNDYLNFVLVANSQESVKEDKENNSTA
jgi:hypothetical protein